MEEVQQKKENGIDLDEGKAKTKKKEIARDRENMDNRNLVDERPGEVEDTVVGSSELVEQSDGEVKALVVVAGGARVSDGSNGSHTGFDISNGNLLSAMFAVAIDSGGKSNNKIVV